MENRKNGRSSRQARRGALGSSANISQGMVFEAGRSHPQHSLAWHVGMGNSQAALNLSEHYEQVIGSDISEAQLKHVAQHPRVRHIHTPTSISNDEMVNLIAGGHENSVDLVTVAEAVHLFDVPQFYSLVKRLLRKQGGIIAVWGYNQTVVSPDFDLLMKRYRKKTLPYWNPNISYIFDGYRTLPFPFESVGLGREGEPMTSEIRQELSFQGLVRFLKSSTAVTRAKDQGVDLLSQEMIKEIQEIWGGPDLVRYVTYKAFMLAGKI